MRNDQNNDQISTSSDDSYDHEYQSEYLGNIYNEIDDSDYLENIYNEIDELEMDFECEEKINNSYYIGLNTVVENDILLCSSITSPTFFKYKINDVYYYLFNNNIIFSIERERKRIDIMKLAIINESYTVIIKTYWIKIIQRHFKKFYRDKNRIILNRCYPYSQKYFSIHGKYPYELRIPSINGILKCYSNKRTNSIGF